MLRRISSRLTYSNVTASLPLFVALGGTSYAAITLPRNSVGNKQIRSSAVTSAEIRGRTIRLSDLHPSTRDSLRGAAGPAGPAGAPSVSYFAASNAAGRFVRGNSTSGGHGSAVGTYTVGFNRSMAGCVFTATIGSADGTPSPTGRATVAEEGPNVAVSTFDDTGAPADRPFHLLAAC